MSGDTISDEGMLDFHEYTVFTPTEEIRKEIGREPDCVADYVQAWVASERGVYACLGDYQVFLITFLAIVDDWVRNPNALCYVADSDGDVIIQRRPETVFSERFGRLDHPVLDSHFFATHTFRAMHGRRPPEA